MNISYTEPLRCPYCWMDNEPRFDEESDLNSLAEGDDPGTWIQECSHCDRLFMFKSHLVISFGTGKAICLNKYRPHYINKGDRHCNYCSLDIGYIKEFYSDHEIVGHVPEIW